MTKAQSIQSYKDWQERKKLMVSPGFTGTKEEKVQEEIRARAEEMIEKTKKLFEEVSHVEIKSSDELIEQLKSLYKEPSEDNCKRWVKNHKKFRPPESTKILYDTWIRVGKAAKEYFGAELVTKIWKE